ncbi:MAG: YihY/virulence factor BrkB family protein [Thermodesulfobacteriota bacterium]|nr:YihY/virulence factor BrkB family protein [Thermodesulfobacteriota bacterium]
MTKQATEPTAEQTRSGQNGRSRKLGRLTQWAFAHHPGEGKVKAALRSSVRVLVIMVQEFFNTNISLRASALTFTIILSMVPLLAMSTAILKGLGSGDQLKTVAYRLIDQLDPEQNSTKPATGTAVPVPNASDTINKANAADESTPQAHPPSLSTHLHNAVDTIFNYVENTNFAALGAFGIAGLLIAVIMVFSSVEEAMNSIWHTRRGRSLFRKIMDYLALLILLPISINVAIAGDAILESPRIMGYISTVIPSAWVVQMLFKLLPFVFITLSLMMMYLFFPHVRVKTLPAFCGAVFASIFWFLVQRAYIVLQIGVAKYNAIYGSFATVPLVLIWIQLGWTFILLGAVLAYAIQNRNHYRLPGTGSKPQQALQRAFDVLLSVYNNFALAGSTTSEQLLASCPGENKVDLDRTVELLTRGGLLHRINENGSAELMPSLPAEKLTAAAVVRLILGHDQGIDTPGGTLADRIIQAAEKVVVPSEFPDKYLTREGEKLMADG